MEIQERCTEGHSGCCEQELSQRPEGKQGVQGHGQCSGAGDMRNRHYNQWKGIGILWKDGLGNHEKIPPSLQRAVATFNEKCIDQFCFFSSPSALQKDPPEQAPFKQTAS